MESRGASGAPARIIRPDDPAKRRIQGQDGAPFGRRAMRSIARKVHGSQLAASSRSRWTFCAIMKPHKENEAAARVDDASESLCIRRNR
jgi:hypothetical protein